MFNNWGRSVLTWLTGAVVVVGIGAAAVSLCSFASAQDLKKLTVFIEPDVHYDSIWMADAKGFYKAEGLDVDFKQFPTGVAALAAFTAGAGDIALSGELPALSHWIAVKGDYRLLTVLERDSKGFVVVAQNSIKAASDLKGKVIATRVGTTGSWFVSEYLQKNHLNPDDVTVKDLTPAVMPTALCKEEIAAFFIWQPFGSRTLEICPDKAHILSDATGYIDGFLVAGARPAWLASPEGKDAATRFLRATLKGKDVAEKDFTGVAQYAADKYKLSEKATRDEWQTNNRRLGFDDVFFRDHCQLASWARSQKRMNEQLDFSKYIWPDGFRSIDPKLVSSLPPAC
ncbi:MAG TPA: ABC transporter substrate-binding protein [Pseudolabrys sp.]|nr:ABC transporter substrate-binding protein [Pseudolabrys sp.]